MQPLSIKIVGDCYCMTYLIPNGLPKNFYSINDYICKSLVEMVDTCMVLDDYTNFQDVLYGLNEYLYGDYLNGKDDILREAYSLNKIERKKRAVVEPFDAALVLLKGFSFKHVHVQNDGRIDYNHMNLCVYVPFEESEEYGLYVPAQWVINTFAAYALPTSSEKQQDSVLSFINKIAPHAEESWTKDLIPVKNGVFDKSTKRLTEYTPEFVTRSKIATEYKPNAVEPQLIEPDGNTWSFDQWLVELADNDKIRVQLFWQVLAAAFNPGRAYNKAILFYSEVGNNGKGTFGQLIKNIIGYGNFSSLGIRDYGSKFQNIQLIGKMVNICDENPVGGYLDDVADFKAAVTGDDILIEQKHKAAYSASIKQLSIQMVNSLPQTRDKSGSFYRRLLVVPFFHTFTGHEKRYIKTEFMNNKALKEYVLAKALEMDSFDTFIEPDVTKEAMTQFKSQNNTVVEFWEEMINEFQWDFLPLTFIYELYVAWMKRFNPRGAIVGKQQFNNYTRTWFDENGTFDAEYALLRVTNAMDADEPLITEYKLENWYNPTYSGDDEKQKRNFTRKERYRGFKRL